MNDIKETAKEIRTVLKSAFPSTKFSVRCHQFSQGEAVAISWTDGPAKNQVEPLVNTYGDGYLRFIKISRKNSAVNVSELEVAEVVTETAPQPQESTISADDQLTELVALQELLISKVEEVNQLKLKIVELQVAADLENYSQRQPKKAEIAQIVLTRDEGTIAESGTTITATD